MALPNKNSGNKIVGRIRLWYGLLVLVLVIFGVRLFYMQVIRYSHYKTAALSDQLKQYQIPATRGIIEAHDGNSTVPIVLNQKLYTLYADPTYVKHPDKDAAKIAGIIGGSASQYSQLMATKNTRYVVLAKRLSSTQSKRLLALKLPGIGTQGQDYRVYPQGQLASQLLGFVDENGKGQYGVEQAMNKQLKGTPGEVKAVTDVNGVPLAASKNNVDIAPKDGDNVVLTIDMAMQSQMESILKQEAKKTHSKELSAVIMDVNNGQVKAMANYPTYNPADYQSVSNPSVFQNGAVTEAIEPGSTMKILTTAAAIDQGVIKPNTTFYDPAHWVVDGFNITDIQMDGGARQQSIASLLNLSLNTGATWELMQMGGGKLDSKGRDAWYNYMTKHYQLGKATGIEQGYEANGYIPPPENNGAGINLTYANSSFGQGVLITPLQMAAADSSVLNGGTYYQPQLVDQIVSPDGKTTNIKPKVVKKDVVSPKVTQGMIPLMEYVVKQHMLAGFSYLKFPSNYIVGGKTGTAQVAKPSGGYYKNIYNGTYVGFVGGDKPQYVIVVYNIRPNVPGYAGTWAGQPVFSDLAHMLIDNSFVDPKSH